MMKRRIDNDLRSAIFNLEEMVLLEPNADDILQKTLILQLRITGSAYGFAYRCYNQNSSSGPSWQFVTAMEKQNDRFLEIKTLSASLTPPEHILQNLNSSRCWYGNTNEVYDIPTPGDHPKIENFLAVPLSDAKTIHGLLVICNSETGYNDSTVQRLRPLIAAANCLLRSALKKSIFETINLSQNNPPSMPEYFSKMLDSMFNAILVIDQHDNITLCNSMAASLLGGSKSEVIGQALSKFLPNGAPKALSVTGEQSPLRNRTIWRGVPARTMEKRKFLVDLKAFNIREESRTLRMIIMEDISERMASAASYQYTLQRFEVLTQLAPIGILQINNQWECIYTNDTWCDACQLTPDESIGNGWLRGIHPGDADEVLCNLREQTNEKGKYEGTFRLRSPLGKTTWVQAKACALYNDRGEVDGFIMTFNDITQQLKNEQHLKSIAETDQLTGLINRTFLHDRIENAVKGVSRYGSIALMFLDLDEFKQINDTLGHDVGDELLIEVAHRLRKNVRDVDTLARIGGDEFTILLTHVHNIRSITVVADKLIEALAKPFILSGRPMYISGSIGIAVAEHDECSVKQLLKQADVALYKAKEAGRNQYKFYSKELDVDADLHIMLRQSLKDSKRNDFRVVYQPQVDALTGKIIGVEALTRWHRDDVKATGPDKFIKMIEESGLINEFSDWLLTTVFKTFDNWRKRHPAFEEITLSVNLSAKQFRNKDLAKEIAVRSKAFNIPAEKVVFEITETALVEDNIVAAESLLKLRKMGFKISLDDFGTGYSSLAYLRSMPLNYVKIDKSFIKNVIQNTEDSKIVAAILNLSETLHLKVVAEGVDNTEVRQWLIDNNCPFHQGYLYHKPLEQNELEETVLQEFNTNAA